MSTLNFDAILAASPLPSGSQTVAVPVPHWNGEVTLRKLAADEYIAFQQRFEKIADSSGDITNQNHLGSVMLFIVANTAIDESGARIFTGDRVEKLNSDPAALLILGLAALKLNKFTHEVSAPKNEEPTPSQNSE